MNLMEDARIGIESSEFNLSNNVITSMPGNAANTNISTANKMNALDRDTRVINYQDPKGSGGLRDIDETQRM